jgi:hypothetical protein
MKRLLCLAAVVAIATSATAVGAPREQALGQWLGLYWKTVIGLPADSSPLVGNGDLCVRLARDVVAPAAEPGVPPVTCTVKAGTKILAVGFSTDCSDVEAPPFHGDTYAEQVGCARDFAAGVTNTRFTVDGRVVPFAEVVTPPVRVTLQAGNLLTGVAGVANLAVDGWVALEHPLPPGTHTFTIHHENVPGFPGPGEVTFFVRVVPTRPGA